MPSARQQVFGQEPPEGTGERRIGQRSDHRFDDLGLLVTEPCPGLGATIRLRRVDTGRHHADWRRALNGIIFRMRSGCQWEKLPRKFGPKSTVHDWFQRWCAGGVIQRIWEVLAQECDELEAVDWQWQAADGRLGKARFGGEKGGEKPHGPREKGHQGKRAG